VARVLLAVGSAPGLYEDLAAAKALYPDAEVMLINGACAAVEEAQHILAGHTEKAEEFVAARDKAFPFALPYRVHATQRVGKNCVRPDEHPSVTDWHPPECSSGATSAGKAALIGFRLGFDRVILVGCPLDGSGYFVGESAGIRQQASCQRVGDPRKQEAATIRRYKKRMAELAETTFKGKVHSMSGYTRELLGYPPAP
jgi:hypothetical protein